MKETLETKNLILKTPTLDDLSELKSFENRNKAHLEKWESISELSRDEDYNHCLLTWRSECLEGRSARFFIFDKKSPQIIGMCNLSQIFRGVFQACYLGYKIDHAYEGKGIMLEALQHTIQFAFEELKLHRIMANYMPINLRSAKLLNRLGFTIEGFAKNYLFISNHWEDHILTALTHEQWQTGLNNPIISKKLNCLIFREATICDLETIVTLLFDDPLGQTRENISFPLAPAYFEAFANISSSPNNEQMVLEYEGVIIGCMQISYLHHLNYQGKKIALIEGVRIHKDYQSKGFGKKMFQLALEKIKNQGCHRVELTTDKKRVRAMKFYESLGFTASHQGMKLFL